MLTLHPYRLYVSKKVALFLMVMFPLWSSGQDRKLPPTVQDCLGAIPVCQPVYSTLISYVGHGNVYPEIHNDGVCPLCMDGEKNDVFYIITVQTDGLLRFTLTPNNPNNDYDWSVFNMTNSDCSQLYSMATTLSVSCNSYGANGFNGPTGINTLLSDNTDCNGPGTANGPKFNKDLPVLAGETYLINISNWSPTQQEGYTLDFTASTAIIYDDVPPLIDSIQSQTPCSGTTLLYVRFSENVLCEDVFNHPEKFSLSGPQGAISVTGVNSADCSTGATQSPVYTLVTASPLFGGSYTLSIVGDIRDLCDNVALYNTYPFTLTEINAPTAGAGNDTTVANGSIITLHGSAIGGTPPCTFHWEPASNLVDPDLQSPMTTNIGASTQFTVTVTDNMGCHGVDDVLVTVVGGPLGVSASSAPQEICLGESSLLQAIPSGGSGNYSFTWTSSPAGFTSNLPNPTVYPSVTTTFTVQIADGYSTTSGTTAVLVHPLPIANAGPDQSIPYGTSATLQGYGTGGSGVYTYLWTSNPPGFISTQQSPLVTNLTVTTVFILRVKDATTGCLSVQDESMVAVTGSPLGVNPVASSPVICKGSPTQLFAMGGGGSGTYTYSWTSVPAGFNSNTANPVVTPPETTTYFLTISDGYNQATGSVNVIVNPVPQIYLGPSDTLVCVYDTVILDAGNPGSVYYWSNGAITPTILVQTAGIGYDIQTYSVRVINPYACIDSAAINVVFTFAACTGVADLQGGTLFRVFPNPTKGLFTITAEPAPQPAFVTVETLLGQRVFTRTVQPYSPGRISYEADLTGMQKGVYLVRITLGDQTSISKIVLN
jgi:hypothetical protein